MGIIFDMNATDVIIFGIRQRLVQNAVPGVRVNLRIGIKRGSDKHIPHN